MFKSKKLKSVLISALLSASFYPTFAHANDVQLNELVVFGDSTSDHGNLKRIVSVLPFTIPVPETFTNGDVWVDYLAEDLNLNVRNYAIGGAKTEGHSVAKIQAAVDAGFLPKLGLKSQVNRYLQETSNNEMTSLKVILIGGNDIIEYLEGNSKFESEKDLIDGITNSITENVKRLSNSGSKNIGVISIPDLSPTPLFNISFFSGNKKRVQLIVKRLNRKIIKDLAIQAVRSNDEYNIFTFNGARTLNRSIDGGEFLYTNQTWLELDENRQPTGRVNGHPDNFLFWDNVHLMTNAHENIATELKKEIKAQSHCLGKKICESTFNLSAE